MYIAGLRVWPDYIDDYSAWQRSGIVGSAWQQSGIVGWHIDVRSSCRFVHDICLWSNVSDSRCGAWGRYHPSASQDFLSSAELYTLVEGVWMRQPLAVWVRLFGCLTQAEATASWYGRTDRSWRSRTDYGNLQLRSRTSASWGSVNILPSPRISNTTRI